MGILIAVAVAVTAIVFELNSFIGAGPTLRKTN